MLLARPVSTLYSVRTYELLTACARSYAGWRAARCSYSPTVRYLLEAAIFATFPPSPMMRVEANEKQERRWLMKPINVEVVKLKKKL